MTKDNMNNETQPTQLPAEVREAVYSASRKINEQLNTTHYVNIADIICAALAPLWPTTGEVLGERVRQQCNKLTAEERASLMEFFWKEYGNTPPADTEVTAAVERLMKFDAFGFPHAPIKPDLRTVLAALEQAQREVSDCRQILHSNSVEMEDMGRILGKEKDRAEASAASAKDLRAELKLMEHRLITCGVAASHPDASLSRRAADYGGPWDSQQAEQVRVLRAERDQLCVEVLRLEHSNNRLVDFEQNALDLRDKTEGMSTELKNLRAQLAAATEDKAAIIQDVNCREKRIAVLEQQLAAAQEQRNDLLILFKATTLVWGDKLSPETLASFRRIEETILGDAAKGGAK